MNRRDALKGLAGAAAFLMTKEAIASIAEPKGFEEPDHVRFQGSVNVLSTFTLPIEDLSKLKERANALIWHIERTTVMVDFKDNTPFAVVPDMTRDVSIEFEGIVPPSLMYLSHKEQKAVAAQLEVVRQDPDYAFCSDREITWDLLQVTSPAASFFKHRGEIITRALSLLVARIDISAQERLGLYSNSRHMGKTAIFDLVYRRESVRQQIRESMRTVKIHIWMKPKA